MQQFDCFSNMVQEFLVCTAVHKGRYLAVFTADTFVRVTLDKTSKSTKTFPSSENPFYNEYFVFELKCTLGELLRKTISYEVRKSTYCCFGAVHGELLIDLSTVWSQPNHFFFKKWGCLEEPLDSENRGNDPCQRGYLQIDLAIITEASNTDLLLKEVEEENTLDSNAIHDYDDIKSNLLTIIDPKVECNIRYTVSFYYGVFTKRADYYIQFIFHPFKGRTKVIKLSNEPTFNESVIFPWIYPSLTETFLIQIFSHESRKWKCLAEYELHFNEIAFNGKPKLGPTFLHFYGLTNPTQYIGRLLIEVRSECLTEKIPPREFVMGKVFLSDDTRWWQNEIFSIQFLPLHGYFLHGVLGNCRLNIRLAEHSSNYLECDTEVYKNKKKIERKLKYFQKIAPYQVALISAELPDNRHKYDSDFFIQEIMDFMKVEIEDFKLFQIKYHEEYEMQRKCLRAIVQSILSKAKDGIAKKRLEYANYTDPTPWDTNRLFYLQEVMRVFLDQMNVLLQAIKDSRAFQIEATMDDVVQQLLGHYKNFSNMLCILRVQDDLAELFLVLSVGNKEVAVCRVNPKAYLNTPAEKEISPSNLCWCVRHFVFKDINCKHTCNSCGCITGIIHGCLGIIALNEHASFSDEILEEWLQPEKLYYCPTTVYSYFKCHIFIHQAKIRPGHDRTGLCDAFARVVFNGITAQTASIPASLSPTWNVVISFECVKLPGLMEWYQMNPPVVAIEMYDVDRNTANDYLGCGLMNASVISKERFDKINLGDAVSGSYLRKYRHIKRLSPPLMKWIPIAVNGMVRAEILASAELVETSKTAEDETKIEPTITLGIPMSIRPTMKNFVLEVVFAGFRNYMKSFSGRHRVKIMMGDLLLSSGLTSSRMRNSINFLVLYASGIVNLPEQLEYWPTIIATDVLVTGKKESTVGAMIMPNSKRYLEKNSFAWCVERDTTSDNPFTSVLVEAKTEKPRTGLLSSLWDKGVHFWTRRDLIKTPRKAPFIDENNFLWWTKFYNSVNKNTLNFNPNKHFLTIFDKELEKCSEFSFMHDWAEPIVMVHGIKAKKNTIPKEEIYATLKLKIRITACDCDKGGHRENSSLIPLAAALSPEHQAKIQILAELCKIVARVYIVQGINLRPRDRNNPSDTFLKVRLGTKSLNNRANYVPNQSNPLFGKCFELDALLPREHLLEITVYDRNTLKDEIIGSTIIDLEDRWRTKHRATFGLPRRYNKTGYNEWRDVMTPSELLSDLCQRNKVDLPTFEDNKIKFDGKTFTDDSEVTSGWNYDELQERLSLIVLKNLHQLPSFGYKLVPEHVETRSLFIANSPGIEQGKIQLWVELYDSNSHIPPPLDISPLVPLNYELRVSILNCEDITRDDKNIFGARMSDIFVRGWCNDIQRFQETDTHYRCLNGKGSFNWRMIFPIKYSPPEDMMIVKRKAGRVGEYETKQPAMIYIQLWDNDVISKDDFLAAFEMNLSNFPEPYSTARDCNEFSIALEKGWRPFGVTNILREGHNVKRKAINLFQDRKVKGWFPLRGPIKQSGNKNNVTSNYAGKIELAIEILTDSEASINPAGLGRNEPNALPFPRRPDTSFNPFTNPGKSCKHILWPFFRKYALIAIVALLVFLIVLLTIINIPSTFVSFFH